MRDIEFSSEFDRLSLRLEQFFRSRLREFKGFADKAIMATDLVQLTVIEAWKNSREPQYAEYTIEKLLFLKAENIWFTYCNPPKKTLKTEQLETIEDSADLSLNALHRITLTEDLGKVQSQADPRAWKTIKLFEQGYDYSEIAVQMNESEDNIRQLKSRLIARIKKRWKNRGYL
jgi:RNA polymerase sigma factor (sigma-70 family)